MRASALSSGDDSKGRVLQATNIVELIGKSVALKQRGREFLGLCPFHQEKTPSFSVNPAKQRFYCHGCEKGGDAITFVMLRDRVEFKDALRQLAEAAGIELPSFRQSGLAASERQILLDAHSAASMFFEKLLADSRIGAPAQKYLAERGFAPETVRQLHLGLAMESWDALAKSPAMKKFTPQQLALAGLLKPRESGEGYYDTFRNRLMFPIRDENGRVIAFGGRVMPGSQDPAKYLNSPETPLFSKSRTVFGLDLARTRIVETRTVAVVEGYTDVVMAHQYGVENVVSVLGTALTEHHVTLLRRFADRIVLLFDGDRAGENAANRAVELFLTQPVEIAIATLPDGMDPDEFLLKNGADAFNQFLVNATDALTFKWKQLLQQMKGTDSLTGQQKAIQQYLETLAKARGSGPVDGLRWGAALTRVSRLTEIPVEDLNRQFKIQPVRTPPTRFPQGSGTPQVLEDYQPKDSAHAPAQNARQRAEGYILGLLLNEPGRWQEIQQRVHISDFSDPPLHRIAELFWRHQTDEGEPAFNEFLGLLEDDLKGLAIRCSDEASNLSETSDPNLMLADCLKYFDRLKSSEEKQKLMADLGRTIEQQAESHVEAASKVDTLRKLQEKARQPNLNRIGL
jgi:DNA primase